MTTTMPNYTEYDEQNMSVVCPVCRAMAGDECAVGGEKMPYPHAQRVDLAYSPIWYCAACDVKTTRNHIVNILSDPDRIGTCKAVQEIPEPEPEPESATLADAMDDLTGVVMLAAPSETATAGSRVQIDDESMTVTDATDPAALIVTRATEGTTAATHEAGTAVLIYPPATEAQQQ